MRLARLIRLLSYGRVQQKKGKGTAVVGRGLSFIRVFLAAYWYPAASPTTYTTIITRTPSPPPSPPPSRSFRDLAATINAVCFVFVLLFCFLRDNLFKVDLIWLQAWYQAVLAAIDFLSFVPARNRDNVPTASSFIKQSARLACHAQVIMNEPKDAPSGQYYHFRRQSRARAQLVFSIPVAWKRTSNEGDTRDQLSRSLALTLCWALKTEGYPFDIQLPDWLNLN